MLPPFLILISLFSSAIYLIGVRGDFPLNDDWSYVTSIMNFASSGEWKPIGFTSMPLITNALWALPACKLWSCDFETSRLMTLFASAMTLLLTYRLLCRLSSYYVAATSAAVIVFNPISLALSFTSMTDAVFWLTFFISVSAFWAYLETRTTLFFLLGLLAALAATMSRQLGLAPPLAFSLAFLLTEGRLRNRLAVGFLPFSICAIVFVAFNHWLAISNRLPHLYVVQSSDLLSSLESLQLLLTRLIKNSSTGLLEVSVFICPILLLTERPRLTISTTKFKIIPMLAGASATILAILDMFALNRIMPLGKDILVREGIGPLTLRDTFVLHLPDVPSLPQAFWICVTLVGLVASYEFVYRITLIIMKLLSHLVQRERSAIDLQNSFLILTFAIYSAPILLVSSYDRYFIPLLLPTIMILSSNAAAASSSSMKIATAYGVTGVMAFFSIFAVHDYLSWNRARWTALDDLTVNKKVSWQDIDGGFEFNGLYGYDDSFDVENGKSPWWVRDDRYIIAFKPFGDGKVIETVPYRTILPPYGRSIVVISR